MKNRGTKWLGFIAGWLAIVMLALLAFGCGTAKQTAPASQPAELNISAAASLKDALAEIQKNYQAVHPEVKLIFNLGGSGALQKQIEQGAPADIFISAAAKQMDELQAKNLVNASTRKDLVKNQLVLIVAKDAKIDIAQFQDVTKGDIQKLAVGELTTVPAGQYAKESFGKLGIWDQIKDKAVYAKDVRTVLAYVETGNVEAGIVYKTDAASSDKVRIAATAPEDSHSPIVYPIAMINNAKQPQAAADFMAYLASADAQKVFQKYGFMTE